MQRVNEGELVGHVLDKMKENRRAMGALVLAGGIRGQQVRYIVGLV
jgi:hypothetical protein